MNKIYAVNISRGDCDDYFTYVLFVTHDKDKAEKYIEKFNGLLYKVNDYIKPYVNYYRTIKRDYTNSRYYKWWENSYNINEAFLSEIEMR